MVHMMMTFIKIANLGCYRKTTIGYPTTNSIHGIFVLLLFNVIRLRWWYYLS